MKLTRQSRFGLWALAAIVIAAAAFFVGSALKPGADPHYIFETEAAAYGEPSSVAATSPGGFTGFGESDGGDSRVVISGRVIEITDTSITLQGAQGQRTALEFGAAPRIFRLEAGSTEALTSGVAVAVRLNAAGDTVESLLVLSQP